MFSSLYWERLEGGREGGEDYINFMYNITINIRICGIIQEQMNVGITLESGKQVSACLTITQVALFPSSFLKYLLLPNLQPFVQLDCLLSLLGGRDFRK